MRLHPDIHVGRDAHVVFVGRGDALDDIDEAAGGGHAVAKSRPTPCATRRMRMADEQPGRRCGRFCDCLSARRSDFLRAASALDQSGAHGLPSQSLFAERTVRLREKSRAEAGEPDGNRTGGRSVGARRSTHGITSRVVASADL